VGEANVTDGRNLKVAGVIMGHNRSCVSEGGNVGRRPMAGMNGQIREDLLKPVPVGTSDGPEKLRKNRRVVFRENIKCIKLQANSVPANRKKMRHCEQLSTLGNKELVTAE